MAKGKRPAVRVEADMVPVLLDEYRWVRRRGNRREQALYQAVALLWDEVAWLRVENATLRGADTRTRSWTARESARN